MPPSCLRRCYLGVSLRLLPCPYRFYFYNGLVDSRSSPILLNGSLSLATHHDYEALSVRSFSITRLRSPFSFSSQDHRLSPLLATTIRFHSFLLQTLLLMLLSIFTASLTRAQYYSNTPPSCSNDSTPTTSSVSNLMLGSGSPIVRCITGSQHFLSLRTSIPPLQVLYAYSSSSSSALTGCSLS